jgi:hypothetical protein
VLDTGRANGVGMRFAAMDTISDDVNEGAWLGNN